MTQNKNGGTIPPAPYDELHIYYLEGIPPRESLPEDGGFLGCWVEGDSSILFFSEPALEKVRELVSRSQDLRLSDSYLMTYAEWQGREALEPLDAGSFRILPYWIQEQTPADRFLIRLDPGLVFGTGLHPTTRDCLSALEWVWQKDPPLRVLDLGTGTGILALAAARLSCESGTTRCHITAVDLNPLCVETARRNVELNEMSEEVNVVCGPAEEAVSTASDLLVANLHFAAQETLLKHPDFFRRRWILLSGLLRSEAREVLHRVQAAPVRVIRVWDDDPVWRSLLFQVTGPVT